MICEQTSKQVSQAACLGGCLLPSFLVQLGDSWVRQEDSYVDSTTTHGRRSWDASHWQPCWIIISFFFFFFFNLWEKLEFLRNIN
jgi:hypothetical protein